MSTAALSVRAGAAAAARAATRGRRARSFAAADHRKGGKHRLGVRALALRADLALALTFAMPKVHFTLLEANTRKCAFLEHVIATLKLANVAVVAGRAEELGHRPALREQFDRAISRAAAPPGVLLELALPFVEPGGDLVAQVSPVDPRSLEPAARLLGGGPPSMERPGNDTGTLLVVPKLGPTPAEYPRRTGVPNRKPLA